jgi:polar amino acid transport system substrate-binding protein
MTVLAASSPGISADSKLEAAEGAGVCPYRHRQRAALTAVGADGKVSGAAPDVAREIFKRLGVADVVASISEYGAMIPGLAGWPP